MNQQRLAQLLESRGEKPFRLRQIRDAVYRQYVASFSDMTSLSLELREALANEPTLVLKPVHTAESKDGTIKTVFELEDGKKIEAVLIPMGDHRTVCVSSQVGCAMKCSFCATGTMGLTRNLTADEIIDQVLYYSRVLAARSPEERVTNVVFMGMGEPCQNLDAVFAAIELFNDPGAFSIGARRISISTCGIVPGILRIAEYPKQINLAISLHAPNDALRTKIMPVNKAYPLLKVIDACHQYINKTNRKLFVEYVMLRGINDAPELAQELADLMRSFRPLVQVNLIPFHQSFFDFRPTIRKDIVRFQQILLNNDIPCTVRVSAGEDISAACGQLANQVGDEEKNKA